MKNVAKFDSQKRIRRNRGGILVESAIYLPLVMIILVILILIGLSKMDIVLRTDRHREQDRQLVRAMTLDGQGRDVSYSFAGSTIGMKSSVSSDVLCRNRLTKEGLLMERVLLKGIPFLQGEYYYMSIFAESESGTCTTIITQSGTYRLSTTHKYQRKVQGFLALLTGESSGEFSYTEIGAFAADHAELERIAELMRNSDAIEWNIGIDSYSLKLKMQEETAAK